MHWSIKLIPTKLPHYTYVCVFNMYMHTLVMHDMFSYMNTYIAYKIIDIVSYVTSVACLTLRPWF